jgi:hypothetical protein
MLIEKPRIPIRAVLSTDCGRIYQGFPLPAKGLSNGLRRIDRLRVGYLWRSG